MQKKSVIFVNMNILENQVKRKWWDVYICPNMWAIYDWALLLQWIHRQLLA